MVAGSSSIKLKDFKIIVIDGQIINVADIHHLLSVAYENKTRILLIARGYSKEVLNTLAVNYSQKKLSIIPFLISTSFPSSCNALGCTILNTL